MNSKRQTNGTDLIKQVESNVNGRKQVVDTEAYSKFL